VRFLDSVCLLLLSAAALHGEPAVFWASDPVNPDETVLVSGDGFGESPEVELQKLPDGELGAPATETTWKAAGKQVACLQPGNTSVKLVVPKSLGQGAYLFRVTGPGGASKPVRLNCPTVYWVQGDAGTAATPGGWIRLFGRCLQGVAGKSRVLLRPEVGKELILEAQQTTPWSLTVHLPAASPAGARHVFVHNGFAGAQGWTDAGRITVAPPQPWPEKVFNVRDSGATGEGAPSDGTAIREALKKAEENGGGVVYFPRGRYQLAGTLTVPKYTVLRGERTEFVCLFWPDTDDPCTLIEGTDHFGVEDLTVYCSNYIHGIAGTLGQPDSGNTFLRRVRVRADMYRGHLKPAEVDARFRASLKRSTGGGDTVRLGGENVEITDCDLYGSGRSLYLLRVRGARVTGNTLYNGRWGWYCLDGSDGLILENNQILGADLMSTGGGLACYTSAYSQNVYYANNKLRFAHGWDREAMTTDAGYGAFYGTVTDIKPDRFALTEEPGWNRKADWVGAGVFILGGRGMGQYRRLAKYEGRQVTLDRPWAVLPDEQSAITITMLHRHYLFVGNEFEDVGIALQYYGTSIDNVAAGNKATRGGGFYNSGRWYRHFQPSWYCQFLDNEILEGNCYRFGPNNADNAGASYLGTFGLQSQGGTSPLALCSVHRRNHLHNGAELRFLGVSEEHPGLKDLVAEHNVVENAERGVYTDSGCVGVLLRENQFVNVAHAQVTEREVREELRKKRAALLDKQDPVAYYSFDTPFGKTARNEAGKEFFATATGEIEYEASVSGKAPRCTGGGYFVVADKALLQFPRLTVSAWVLPDQLKGRWGVVAKRSRGGTAPYVLAIREGGISFEATDQSNQWSYNLTTSPVLKANAWNHLAATCEDGVGVKVYCNGELVGEKAVTQPLIATSDVLTIGYENWGGPDAKPGDSGNFRGLIDEVKVWSRLLSAEQIRAEYDRLKAQADADQQRRAKEAADQAALQQRFQNAVVAAGGIEWQLVKADDFQRDALGPDWKTLRGKWTIKEGVLTCADISFLGYAKKVASPVRLEFDARSKNPGDLTAFWGTEKAAYEGGYFLGFASNGNTAGKILRLGEQVLVKDGVVATPGKWHHVLAQVFGGKVQLLVDGKLALEYVDPKPVTVADMPGLLAWSEGEFDNVRIYAGK